MEQPRKETLRAWIEPWKPLRVPLIFNLRRDPYERAYFTSNTYYDWLLDRAFFLVPAQAYVAQFIATFKEFPPRQKAATFNRGFKTVEFLASALVDMRLHLGPPPADPAAFERDALAALGMPAEIVMRHRTPHFSHIFSGDGYSAAYYSYLWADTLTADAWEAFTEAGGPWDETVAKRLHDRVFSVGNTIDPADGYRAFRGRDAGIGGLMRKRGFSV
jgi:hypothetical protein